MSDHSDTAAGPNGKPSPRSGVTSTQGEPTQGSTADAQRTRHDLGRANRRAVLGEIIFGGSLSRTAIAARTGLTGASVSRITRDLLDAGLITEKPRAMQGGGPGRRFVDLAVDPRGGYVLGVGLNVFQQFVTLADIANNVLGRIDLALSDLSSPESVIEQVIAAAGTLIDAHVDAPERLFGGCVAITGAVDPLSGVVRASPYFGWRDVNIDLADQLEAALGASFHIENLPNAINQAEATFGLARQARNTLLVHGALGLGGSLYLDGRLARGAHFDAGHIGNLPTCGPDGRQGTLDELAGGRGILSALGETDVGVGAERADVVAAGLLSAIAMADAGDAKAAAVMTSAGETLGRALAMFAGLTHPEMILLSGPLPRAEIYAAACRAALAEHWPAGAAPPPLAVSGLSNSAAARWLAIGEFLVNRDLDTQALTLKEAS